MSLGSYAEIAFNARQASIVFESVWPMEISSRSALPGDLETVQAIFSALAEEIAEDRGASLQLAERRIAVDSFVQADGLLSEPDRRLIVGVIDQVVVGVAAVRVAMFDSTKVGVIDGYGVLEDARGVGVGEAMIDEVLAFCQAAGCVGVDADALPGARETKNFFETFGFTARRLVVHHRFKNDEASR